MWDFFVINIVNNKELFIQLRGAWELVQAQMKQRKEAACYVIPTSRSAPAERFIL